MALPFPLLGIEKDQCRDIGALHGFFCRSYSCSSVHFCSPFFVSAKDAGAPANRAALSELFCLLRIGIHLGRNDSGAKVHPLSRTARVRAQHRAFLNAPVQWSWQFYVVVAVESKTGPEHQARVSVNFHFDIGLCRAPTGAPLRLRESADPSQSLNGGRTAISVEFLDGYANAAWNSLA